jgi:hypothetical protein
MSKIFKRPMFRKGGNVGTGIMTGIVDRENHANSDPMGVGNQTFQDTVKNRMDLIQSAVGGSAFDDPLTSFLLQYGPAVASAKPTGSTIGTLVGAAQKPVADLLQTAREKRKLKTGVALEVLDKLSDDDIAPFIEKAKQISKETGRPYEEVLNELYQTEIYRKEQSPKEKQEEKFEVDMAGLISQKDLRGNPIIGTYAAQEVVEQINKVKKGEVEGVEFSDIDIDQPYLRKDTDYTVNQDGSITINEDVDADEYQDGKVIYDYRTNKFYRKQGTQLIPIGG